MKWVHPNAVMLARIRGAKVHCDTCAYDHMRNPRSRVRDGGFWCGKRLNDPNPNGNMIDPEQVCRHWKPRP